MVTLVVYTDFNREPNFKATEVERIIRATAEECITEFEEKYGKYPDNYTYKIDEKESSDFGFFGETPDEAAAKLVQRSKRGLEDSIQLTTEHPSSSHNLPVAIIAGIAYGPDDTLYGLPIGSMVAIATGRNSTTENINLALRFVMQSAMHGARWVNMIASQVNAKAAEFPDKGAMEAEVDEKVSSESGINFNHQSYSKSIWKHADGTFSVEGQVQGRQFDAGPFTSLENALNDSSEDDN